MTGHRGSAVAISRGLKDRRTPFLPPLIVPHSPSSVIVSPSLRLSKPDVLSHDSSEGGPQTDFYRVLPLRPDSHFLWSSQYVPETSVYLLPTFTVGRGGGSGTRPVKQRLIVQGVDFYPIHYDRLGVPDMLLLYSTIHTSRTV